MKANPGNRRRHAAPGRRARKRAVLADRPKLRREAKVYCTVPVIVVLQAEKPELTGGVTMMVTV